MANDLVTELLAALERLDDAADAYRADQSRAKDARCGLVQPVTVAQAEELNQASSQARRAILKAKMVLECKESA